MRYRKTDVVARAIALLDSTGVDQLSMRKLAADLGIQPSALYHHFTNKDALLAAIAEELLVRGRRGAEIVTWDAELRLVCAELRDAMLACRDGAALVARVHALGLGATGPEQRMADALSRAGADGDLARVGARTLQHFVFGHVIDEQLQQQGRPTADRAYDTDDFHVGLTVVLAGLRARLG
ncbi:TetR family transcriptional regulator [Nocardioides caeni]|uniref:TetR family transcriptional regulator n=1 Tax=Nocardioides caeni TaxID=574700 RepID=A0A4V4HLC8_9ACTN|nr:TetR family transcriptional regulator [Nocardioides caeni]THV17766.1 TetR family transcriptional regulator [Nocardioides caeni]